MSLDFDELFMPYREEKLLKVKIDNFNRTKYRHRNFIMNRPVKSAFCDMYLQEIEREYVGKLGFDFCYQRFLIYFEITRELLINKDYFDYNHYKRCNYYSDDIFDESSGKCIKYYIYNRLNSYHESLKVVDVEADTNQLYNMILKISIKFFINNDKESSKSTYGNDLRKLSKDHKWVVKCRMLECLRETPEPNVVYLSNRFHVHYNTAKRLLEEYRENPLMTYDDLKEERRGPEEDPFRIIKESVLNELCYCLVELEPDDFGLDYSAWTGRCVKEFLKKKFNVEVTMSYLYYFLARHNIVSKFASRLNPRQNKLKKLKFINEVYPELISLASKHNSKIVFADETHLMQGYNQRGYAPIGKRTHVTHNQSCKHTKYSLFTVMGPDGFFRCFKIEGTFTSEKFINCLEQLHKEYPNTTFTLILDNCHVHNSEEVNTWLESLYEDGDPFVRIYFLPPYCPEINPVEYFNQDLKSYLRKLKLKTAKDVINATDDYLNQFITDASQTKSKIQNFFLGEECDYSLISVIDFIYKEGNAA